MPKHNVILVGVIDMELTRVEKDEQKAVEWYQEAAEQEIARANFGWSRKR